MYVTQITIVYMYESLLADLLLYCQPVSHDNLELVNMT